MKILIFLLVATLSGASEPLWILDPSQGGKYIGSIGCAQENNNTKTQEKRALLIAKSNLSQEMDLMVKTKSHHKVTVHNDMIEEEFDFENIQTSASSFEIILKEKYRYKDSLLCVWIIKK